MPNQKNLSAVSELEQKIKDFPNLIVTSYQGMSTPQLNEIREKVRPLGGQYSIVKNTLTRIALKNAGLADFAQHFVGTTAVAFQKGDPAALSKAIADISKNNEKLKILAGYLDGKIFSAKEVAVLATLPSKEVLLTQLAVCLNQPIQRTATVLNAPIQKLAMLLKAVEAQKAAA